VTITVRRPEYADLGRYTELAVEFITAAPISKLVDITPDNVADFLVRAVDNSDVGMWMASKDGAVVGICGALRYPLYFNPQHTIVQELWWWLTPDARGSGAGQAMYKELERWAKESDAAAIFMIALDDDRVEKTSKFYARAGYKPLERTFAKGAESWR
jgi:RimJ/RimL family protein N-acetyltransferase